MPRPLHLLSHEFPPTPGGIATYIEETARAAAQERAVHVWAPGPAERNSLYTRHPLASRGQQDWLDRGRLLQSLRHFPLESTEAILCLAEPGPLRLWLYEGLLPLPLFRHRVLVFHGSELQRLQALPHRRWLLRRCLRGSARVGVVSEATRALLARLDATAASEAVLVPGAVRPLPVVSRPPKGPPLEILTVGRLHPCKGQLRVIQALGKLPPDLRNAIRYRCVGRPARPAYAESLRQESQRLGVDLELSGPVDAWGLAEAYARSDLFVLASEAHGASIEGLGLVLLEAAAQGLPIAATRTGGIPEAVADHHNALLVPPGDTAALAEALERLLRDADLRQRLGAAGPAWVEQHFSWERNVRLLFAGLD